jgi:hypothetical protein
MARCRTPASARLRAHPRLRDRPRQRPRRHPLPAHPRKRAVLNASEFGTRVSTPSGMALIDPPGTHISGILLIPG